MAIANSISRLTDYYRRHGVGATIRRVSLAVKRELFSRRMVAFYCELGKQTTGPINIPSSLKVERLRKLAELSPHDLQEMTSFWNPKQAKRNIRERFDKEALLWLIRSGDTLAGYGWTLHGRTIEPYYFPLAQDDVHLFDFYVFPQYRGKGINSCLVIHILLNLATHCRGRAFIETAEWNEAQLSSLRKTPFRCLGWVRSFTMFGHTVVSWVEKERVGQLQKGTEQCDEALTIARPHG
jgi:GNAT superfamily N-acetyltransferase